jgi:hypothetical protein
LNKLSFGHAFYLLNNYDELSSGIWPDPRTSESLCAKQSFLEAGFWKPCETAAELAMRVKRCWPDGTLVEARFMRPGGLRPIKSVAKEYFLTYNEVHRLCCCVISYISEGWTFPPGNYKVYKAKYQNTAEWRRNTPTNAKIS